MELSLNRKFALVCGSTQGIGRAIALELALLGANCILLARDEVKLKEVVAALPADIGQEHSYAVADFAVPKQVETALQELVTRYRITILVNNTGGPAAGPIIEAGTIDFEAAFRQHLVVNHLLVQALLPGMKEVGFGRIINIISTSVKIPLNNLGVSNTIRGAVAAWAKSLANELGAFGITVNNVLPGFTSTARLDSLAATLAKSKGITVAEQTALMAAEVPAKRFGTAAEIAAIAAFLATPAAAYVNGASIPVDGGRTGSI
ncbi:SDR family oxidoreductase [Flavihumibacter fluvii]|uniref:SDR family oxidoreductase n=1 Tax=Flavihumibacter fluvii TaxID=2838157 RepID=UPI001BDEDB08|nr:SDR family oxidoreductase [Flavihumibacter fluvii]ULQ52956.1 SDR family oxidoreductase [Flavihumibacter fluvii]